MTAALEHEFNNHHFCSSKWCKYVSHPEVKWTKINIESGGKLKNKEDNKEMYEMVKNVHDLFLTDKNLLMLNHEYDSQKNEALNKAFSKVAPKNMVFSKSWSLSDQLCLVISYDSIGFFETFKAIFEELLDHPNYEINGMTAAWCLKEDQLCL